MFIRDKNVALGKHVYPGDERPSDAFLSWWQVDVLQHVVNNQENLQL